MVPMLEAAIGGGIRTKFEALTSGERELGERQTDHDTARFAAQTILTWWKRMGRTRYPDATELLVTTDGGGSNSIRCRLWKIALQELADVTGLTLHVSHFPPGRSKWNKIEHRLFCHVTRN